MTEETKPLIPRPRGWTCPYCFHAFGPKPPAICPDCGKATVMPQPVESSLAECKQPTQTENCELLRARINELEWQKRDLEGKIEVMEGAVEATQDQRLQDYIDDSNEVNRLTAKLADMTAAHNTIAATATQLRVELEDVRKELDETAELYTQECDKVITLTREASIQRANFVKVVAERNKLQSCLAEWDEDNDSQKKDLRAERDDALRHLAELAKIPELTSLAVARAVRLKTELDIARAEVERLGKALADERRRNDGSDQA
jgi:TolA-binding protein